MQSYTALLRGQQSWMWLVSRHQLVLKRYLFLWQKGCQNLVDERTLLYFDCDICWAEDAHKPLYRHRRTNTHGDSSSIPLIWETHIRVSCVMLLTNNRVTICHLQHPETVSTYFLSYHRSFILFFLFLDKYNIKPNCMLLLEKENNLFYSRLALWTTHPESWTTKIIVFL